MGAWLNLQFLENLTHLLQCTDACGYEWQTEDILDETHLMKHGFHSGGITIDEEQTEQFGEAMVYLACTLILSLELKTNHARELLGQRITDNTDDSLGSTRNHREREGIVATDHSEVLRFVLDNLIHLFKTATGFLDSNDILAVACKSHSGLGLQSDSRTPGYII